MEATTTTTVRAEATSSGRTLWGFLEFLGASLARVLVDGARGDSFDRVFTTSSASLFTTLPRSQQNRILDRGFRPG